jgi:hypothetical protein
LGSWPPNPKTDYIRGYGCYGRIDYIECVWDGEVNQTFRIDDYTPHAFYKNQMTTKLYFSQSLSFAEGWHFLKINAFGSFYPDRFSSDPYRTRQIVNGSVETSFRVWYTSPKISVISPQSKTYGGSDVPLTFEIDRPAVCIFSLDGADNSSLTGNTTLTELSEGPHSLVVYAADAAGNTGKSEDVFFEVTFHTQQPTPEPTTSPSTSPSLIETATPKPTATASPSPAATPSPSPSPSPTPPFLSGTSLAVVIAVVVIVASAVVFLVLAKRKR